MQGQGNTLKQYGSSDDGNEIAFRQVPRPSQTSMDCDDSVRTNGKDSTLDDLDLMLLHEDFPKLLSLSAQVKGLRNTLVNAPTSRRAISSALSPEQIHGAVERMRDRLIGFPKNRHQSVKRGSFAITDITIDDAISTLQRELDHLNKWIEERNEKRSRAGPASLPKRKKKGSVPISVAGDAENGFENEPHAPLALKYSKWQTDILMNWMVEHIEEPFPDQFEIQTLMEQTGLSQHQVVNWTTNVRKRNRKATCEAGKKPHHFIDFMFLVHDREGRENTSEDQSSAPTPNPPLEEISLQNDHWLHLDDRERNDSSRTAYHHTSPVVDNNPAIESSVSDPYFALSAENSQFEYHGVQWYPFHRRDNLDSFTVEGTEKRNLHSPAAVHRSMTLPETTYFDEEDDISPLALEDEVVNEELMHDFADLWLRSEGKRAILPSVTEDSHDNEMTNEVTNQNGSSRKREHASSLDLEDLFDEDIQSWAKSIGVAIQI